MGKEVDDAMLAAKRLEKIVQIIQERGSVEVEYLAKQLGVSSMTIRRDLLKLEQNNKIERCHGGAIIKQEQDYGDRRTLHHEIKAKLAEKAVSYVKDGDYLFLDAGTTTYEIAKKLQKFSNLVVVTNDLEIARVLLDTTTKVLICGGIIQNKTGSTWGDYAMQMLEDFRFDIGFFGATAINEQLEVMTPTMEKSFLKRKTIQQCEKAYLVVDESKFRKQGMIRISHLNDYTEVITNYKFSDREKGLLQKENRKGQLLC